MGKRNAQEYTLKTQVKVKLNLKRNIVDKEDKKHNKSYYDYGRNGYYPKPTTTLQDDRIPKYYIGKQGYEARKVVDNFDLNYNLGTAVTYLLRAYRKHDTPVDCIKKAIAHLEFELEKLK